MSHFTIEITTDEHPEYLGLVIAPEGTTEAQARQAFLDRHSYHPIDEARIFAALIHPTDIITIS